MSFSAGTACLPLLEWGATRYPETPGSKGDLPTGKQAAAEMHESAPYLRELVLQTLKRGDFTADEIAHQCGKDILAIRPRCSELRALGKIKPADATRAASKQPSGP